MSSFVGGVDSGQAFAGVSGTSFKEHMRKVLEPVAGALGVSGDELDSDLKSGKSLSDVAAEKGVSRDDLLAAIKKGLQSTETDGTENTSELAGTAAAATTASTARLDTLVARIADHKHGHGHGHGHHGPPPVDDGSTEQTSNLELLRQAGIDPQALIKQLQSGETTPSTAAAQLGLSAQAYASLLSGAQVDIKA